MKAYLTTHLVVDHDEMSGQEVADVIDNARYPNRCISPTSLGWVELDIGEWTEDHLLNNMELLESKPQLAAHLSECDLTDQGGSHLVQVPEDSKLSQLVSKVQEAFTIMHSDSSEAGTCAAYEKLEGLLKELGAVPPNLKTS